MPRSIQVGVPSGWFVVTALIAPPRCGYHLNASPDDTAFSPPRSVYNAREIPTTIGESATGIRVINSKTNRNQ